MGKIDWGKERQRGFVLVAMLAYLIGLAPHLMQVALGNGAPPAFEWHLTHLHVSYTEFGFLRRALPGTILAPVLAGLPDGGFGEYALMLGLDAMIVLGLAVVLARLLMTPGESTSQTRLLAGLCLIAPVGFMQLGYDAGRLDHVNLALLALALWQVQRGRIALAAGLGVIMLLIHEAALFYAIPLLAAFASATPPRAAVQIALPATLSALALALWGGGPPDLAERLPQTADLAASVWARGTFEPARGFAPMHYLLTAYLITAPLLLLWRHYRANGTAPDLIFAAPFACLCLFVLGVDYGRWSHLIFIVVTMILALAPALGRKPAADLGPLPLRLALIPWALPLGPVGIAVLYPYIGWLP